MREINSSLLALSNEHSGYLGRLIDDATLDAERAYAKADIAQLRSALIGIVQRVRGSARDAAVSHVRDQLAAIIGDRAASNVAFSINSDPLRTEVVEYIGNAVDAAKTAVASGLEVSSTSWQAARIIESEVVAEYDEGRRVAESSLASMSDSHALALGFSIARHVKKSDRAANVPMVPLVGKRWNASGDNATCEECKTIDGDLQVLAASFRSNPPLHPRCRCVTSLWVIGYSPIEKSYKMDGPVLRQYVGLDTRSRIDEDARVIFGAVASDESLDSHDSVILVDGWDLGRYANNPVLLWNHKSNDDPEYVLGRSAPTKNVAGKKLLVDLHFAPKGENPKADLVWGQIQRKEVNGLSVGFRPKSYRYEREDTPDEHMVIEKAELVEISVVTIPSNPQTLIQQMRFYDMNAGKNTSNSVADCGDAKPVDKPEEDARNMVDQHVTTLPADVAAILGTTDIREATQIIAKDKLRITQLEEESKRAREDAEQSRAALDSYRNEASDRAVEELIELKLIKEGNRATAQTFARGDLAGFMAMYAESRAGLAKRNAPKAYLLQQEPVVKTNRAEPARPIADFSAKLRTRVTEIMKQSKTDIADAYTRATQELIANG